MGDCHHRHTDLFFHSINRLIRCTRTTPFLTALAYRVPSMTANRMHNTLSVDHRFRVTTITTVAVSWKVFRTGPEPATSRPGLHTTSRCISSAQLRWTVNSRLWGAVAVPVSCQCASTKGPGTRCPPNGYISNSINSTSTNASVFPVLRRRSWDPRQSAPVATSTRAKKVSRSFIASTSV